MDDIPPHQRRGDEPRLVHQWSPTNPSRMRCGLLRRMVLCGSKDILEGKQTTCLWCVVGKY